MIFTGGISIFAGMRSTRMRKSSMRTKKKGRNHPYPPAPPPASSSGPSPSVWSRCPRGAPPPQAGSPLPSRSGRRGADVVCAATTFATGGRIWREGEDWSTGRGRARCFGGALFPPLSRRSCRSLGRRRCSLRRRRRAPPLPSPLLLAAPS